MEDVLQIMEDAQPTGYSGLYPDTIVENAKYWDDMTAALQEAFSEDYEESNFPETQRQPSFSVTSQCQDPSLVVRKPLDDAAKIPAACHHEAAAIAAIPTPQKSKAPLEEPAVEPADAAIPTPHKSPAFVEEPIVDQAGAAIPTPQKSAAPLEEPTVGTSQKSAAPLEEPTAVDQASAAIPTPQKSAALVGEPTRDQADAAIATPQKSTAPLEEPAVNPAVAAIPTVEKSEARPAEPTRASPGQGSVALADAPAASKPVDFASEKGTESESDYDELPPPPPAPSPKAIEARVRRLTKPRADGTFALPEMFMEQWKDLETGRTALLHLFEKCNFEIDCGC